MFGTYPEGIVSCSQKTLQKTIQSFAHMGEASYLAPIGSNVLKKRQNGQVVKRYIAVSQKKKQGYYCYRYL